MAADLVRRNVDVLAASGGSPSVLTGDVDPVQRAS
jgi:hypothetical protein